MTTQGKKTDTDSNAISWRYGVLTKSEIRMVKKWLGVQRNKNEAITQVVLHFIQRYGYKDILEFEMQRKLFTETLMQQGVLDSAPIFGELPQGDETEGGATAPPATSEGDSSVSQEEETEGGTTAPPATSEGDSSVSQGEETEGTSEHNPPASQQGESNPPLNSGSETNASGVDDQKIDTLHVPENQPLSTKVEQGGSTDDLGVTLPNPSVTSMLDSMVSQPRIKLTDENDDNS